MPPGAPDTFKGTFVPDRKVAANALRVRRATIQRDGEHRVENYKLI